MKAAAQLALRETRIERMWRFARAIALSYGGMSAADILGRSRKVPLPEARHELMAQLWESGMALIEVGRLMKMDHTSVLHGVRRVRSEYDACSRGQGVVS